MIGVAMFNSFIKRWLYDRDWIFLFRSYLFIPKKLLRAKIRRHLGYLYGRVLDVGCGKQPYRRFISTDFYVGLEYNSEKYPSVVADADRLPFGEDIFDSVLCTELIEHAAEPKRVLNEINLVLKPGGRLLISVPMSWNLHYIPSDFYRFTKYGLSYLLEQAGFEIEIIDRVGGVFSLAGARMTEVVSLSARRFLSFLPFRAGGIFVRLFVAIPMSLFFYILGMLLDRLDQTDAINWVALARKKGGV